MLSRGERLILSLALLVAMGAAWSTPCCTMEHLSQSASALIADCCDSSNCCRVETRGPEQAALIQRSPEVAMAAALASSQPLEQGEAAVALRAGLALSSFANDHPPPLNGRDTHLRISLLRI